MLRRLLLPLAILALSLTAVAVGNAGTQTIPVLTGEVGPGFSIELQRAGKDVKTLKAGTYTIKVQDKASIHNFHLKGPGVNKSTTVPFTGKQTWKVTLKPGKYTYQCDPHAATGMKKTFKVTA
ncbi:MAG: plastocyanin/azurin family copper-binding protein [Gaiellaceae bacterium]